MHTMRCIMSWQGSRHLHPHKIFCVISVDITSKNRRNHHRITNTWKRSRTFVRAAKVYINTILPHKQHRLDVCYDDGKCSRNECVQLGAGDNVDSLTHVCYVLGMSCGIDRKAPRSLQIICSFLNFGVVQSISKIIKNAKLYEESFCLLEVSLLRVGKTPVGHRGRGPPRPRRTGNPRHVAFMMSLESVNSSKQKSLDKELLKMNRSFMFLEDMEAALRRGGGNALAKYFAEEVNASEYFAMPPDVKDVHLRCNLIPPKNIHKPGVLRRRMYRGRPLKETPNATTAAVQCVSRAEACVSGWVVDF